MVFIDGRLILATMQLIFFFPAALFSSSCSVLWPAVVFQVSFSFRYEFIFNYHSNWLEFFQESPIYS